MKHRIPEGGRYPLLLSLLILLSVSVMGCTTDSGTAGRGTVLTVMQSSVSLGDPHICSDSVNRLSLVFSVYDALVARDHDGQYQPALAESWAISEEGRMWTFTLRENVRFHNGDVLEADDVVATLERVLDPSIGGSFGTQGVYLSYLEGAEISAEDDRTVVIVTREPMADLFDLLVAMPISPASELGRLPDEYVGSGPYRIREQTADRTTMEAHGDWWGGTPAWQEIHWIAESDPDRRVEMLLAGDADVIADIGLGEKEVIEKEGSALTHEMASGLCIIFMCNALQGPCTDLRVRQALNYALDIDAIIREVKGGAATRLTGYLTPHHFGYDPGTPAYPHNPDWARTLLADAGYADGLELVLDIPSGMPDEAPDLARLMAEQYRQVGISVEIVVHYDRAAYSEMVREKRINDACCFDSSPRSTWRVLREKISSDLRGPWWEGYENLRVNELIREAETTFDDRERQGIYREIYELITDDAPWIFLYSPTRFWGVNSRTMKDWRPRADQLLLF
ncbi:ABC transporter substrate-binding protein [Gemmatimonadota bacterium]